MNSFNSRSVLKVGSKDYEIYRIDALDKQGISTKHLPFSLRILLENLLRTEDGRNVTAQEVRALAAWNSNSKAEKEIAFTPSRVLLQDFTGVPAVVTLAAMRDAMQRLGGDARSTTAGTPVKSCKSTRLGVKAISFSAFELLFQAADARGDPRRSHFGRLRCAAGSPKIRSEKGKMLVEMPCLSTSMR